MSVFDQQQHAHVSGRTIMTTQQPSGETHQSGSKVALIVIGFMAGVVVLVYLVKILFGN
jgi:hypothetical protein